MTVYNQNGKALRFYGRLNSTAFKNEQVILVALEAENKPNFTKVIFIQRLPSTISGELRKIIENPRCQSLPESIPLWDYLQQQTFTETGNQSAYQVMMNLNCIKDIPSDEVLVECPAGEFRTPREVIDAIQLAKNRNALKKTGIENKAQNALSEREEIVSSKLNGFDNRLTQLEQLITNMASKFDAVLTGTTMSSPKEKVRESVNEPVREVQPRVVAKQPIEEDIPEYLADLPPIRS